MTPLEDIEKQRFQAEREVCAEQRLSIDSFFEMLGALYAAEEPDEMMLRNSVAKSLADFEDRLADLAYVGGPAPAPRVLTPERLLLLANAIERFSPRAVRILREFADTQKGLKESE